MTQQICFLVKRLHKQAFTRLLGDEVVRYPIWHNAISLTGKNFYFAT